MEQNIKLPKIMPTPIEPAIRSTFITMENLYQNMIKGSSSTSDLTLSAGGKVAKVLAKRLNGKEGRIRKNLLGKRTRYMARSVLTCDPTLEVDQIGIPLKIARGIQIPEVVREYNIDRLLIYFNNKTHNYPGSTHVYKHSKGEKYLVDKVKTLEIGDTIYRDLINGDVVALNRQPSLLPGNILGMRVVVLEKGDSFRINESACNPFNADFDGDAANINICLTLPGRIELNLLCILSNMFINRQKRVPYFGCFQDSLLATSQITRTHIRADKWHTMQMFSNILIQNHPYLSFDKETYTGREIISKILPKINLSKRTAQMYMEQFSPFIKYHLDEIYVEIKRGELISGVLDKKIVGQSKAGSIFHIINNEYGSKYALDCLHDFHQLVMKFFLWNSYTVGLRDILLPNEITQIIREKTDLVIKSAQLITERIYKRELVAPIGTTLENFYESEQMNALELCDDFIEAIYSNIDTNEGLIQCVLVGSKGDQKNTMAIYGATGQMMIGSKRQSKNFGNGRTSPYFLRNDRHPCANGFIDNSYREGVRSDIYLFAAAESRYNEIMKALSTSVAGSQGRICNKNIESIIVNNLRSSAKKDVMVQLLYAETGIDPAKVELVRLPTILISKQKLEAFKADIKKFNRAYQNVNVAKELSAEFDIIKADREYYRKIAFNLHYVNLGKHLISNEHLMPFNLERIIDSTVFTYTDEIKNDILDPVYAIKEVKKLCEKIAYCYFNPIYESAKGEIPEYIQHALTLIRIYIRSYLCTAKLLEKNVSNKMLDIIIQTILTTFKKALVPYGLSVGIIAAQCLSEPQTQYVIDSKHLAGGGGGSKTGVIDRIKEIQGAKKTAEMKNTSMLIAIKPEFNNKSKMQEIANNIEMMNLETFISETQIFFENFGQPIHPRFKDEEKMITEFIKYHASTVPQNLSKWCIRFLIDKENLHINGMKLMTIITKLRECYPSIFFVHTPENAPNIIIRCYLQNNMIQKDKFHENIIIDIANKLKETMIRGIKNIVHTELIEIPISKIIEDESIINTKELFIETTGTNLEEILELPVVDKYRTQTNSIEEILLIGGIEAAKLKIVNEIQKAMSTSDAITEHCLIVAEEMTSSGIMTSIQKTGLQSRDASNIALQLAFQAPIQVITKAATDSIVEHVQGISGPLIYGEICKLGTTYNDIILDEQMLENYMKKNQADMESVLQK